MHPEPKRRRISTKTKLQEPEKERQVRRRIVGETTHHHAPACEAVEAADGEKGHFRSASGIDGLSYLPVYIITGRLPASNLAWDLRLCLGISFFTYGSGHMSFLKSR